MSSSKFSPNTPCPCGRGKKYKQCCRPFHNGKPAPTPEALMRSRYTAYAINNVAYIINTTHPQSPLYQANTAKWAVELGQFCASTRFERLTVQSTSSDSTETGWVTFTATLFQGTRDVSFTERSLFRKQNGKWLYVSGDVDTIEADK